MMNNLDSQPMANQFTILSEHLPAVSTLSSMLVVSQKSNLLLLSTKFVSLAVESPQVREKDN